MHWKVMDIPGRVHWYYRAHLHPRRSTPPISCGISFSPTPCHRFEKVLMSKSLFISYSRQEVPFVDILLEELEERKIQTWLDYRSLVPGKPWLEQIISGIDNADV